MSKLRQVVIIYSVPILGPKFSNYSSFLLHSLLVCSRNAMYTRHCSISSADEWAVPVTKVCLSSLRTSFSHCSSEDEEFARAGGTTVPPESPFDMVSNSRRHVPQGNGGSAPRPAKRQRKVPYLPGTSFIVLILKASTSEMALLSF